MNSTTYIIGGVLLIIVGVFGIYHIREFPGLTLFASTGVQGIDTRSNQGIAPVNRRDEL